MMLETSVDAVSVGQLCLQQIEALRGELEAATDAIARNCLADFERSLWQQEMLSTNLRRNLAVLDTFRIDAALRTRVQTAGFHLQQAGQTYQRLVEQSSRFATVLQDLGMLYQHGPGTAVSTHPQLSCEA
ncbi:MAG: hypothetical protein ACRYF4_11615 [Janthinobacterium lividum]